MVVVERMSRCSANEKKHFGNHYIEAERRTSLDVSVDIHVIRAFYCTTAANAACSPRMALFAVDISS